MFMVAALYTYELEEERNPETEKILLCSLLWISTALDIILTIIKGVEIVI